MGEKRLTPRRLSCGTTPVNEVFVARHYRHGSPRRLTRDRELHMGHPRTWGGIMVCPAGRALVLSIVLAATTAGICGVAPMASAQSTVDEIHISPRVEPPKPDPTDYI